MILHVVLLRELQDTKRHSIVFEECCYTSNIIDRTHMFKKLVASALDSFASIMNATEG